MPAMFAIEEPTIETVAIFKRSPLSVYFVFPFYSIVSDFLSFMGYSLDKLSKGIKFKWLSVIDKFVD